jgi:multidrug efflux pump subunit AcrA (membrane-fusion protein)
MANLLTKGDGREYRGGELINQSNDLAYIPKDRSPTRVRDPFATTAVSDRNNGMDALMARTRANKAATDAAAAQAAATAQAQAQARATAQARARATVKAPTRDKDQSGKAADRAREAISKASKNLSTNRPKGTSFRKSDNARGFIGGFNEGGLASKPIAKTKKTKKRGLAARK